ncbi:serine/threonine protein kinase [Pyxidicoccus parkwayensis]|uniref:Serine/threonine protein kinase n=1 Tax=Pyxidicoccus parkwayensis TaxID=2813578 RepID=A0ABX7P719_9BACT|nr:serine/threonine-protein kinase [Pyxidicoccus parkwaysis]QSQ26257.1 serine/threonine protein kinase [Pyxidicoccus parkwaysis]
MSATYRLTGRIEAGELAELYEGLQLPGSEVVVKLFHPKTSDPAYALDLAETTRLLQAVRHPGILHVVDIGVVRQRLAVVREDLDGFTLGLALQRLHTKEVVLPLPVALHIIIQLLEAVQQAHEAGVLHGALTPGNVVLSREGLPAVCDFGALRALLAVPQLRRAFGKGRGTYRAPEVTRGEAFTEQSDIYSLGAIAYELLTQREPVVSGGGGVSTRRSEALPPPSRLDRRINARLDPLILRALDPNPQRRFRSCGEFAASLRNFLSASGGMPSADDVGRFVGELFPNEVSLAGMVGPAPFKETFTLEPISGAEMDDLRAEEPEASIIQRAPFSRSLPAEEEASADTQDSADPAFEEYRPEDYEAEPAASHTRTRSPEKKEAPAGEGETTGPGQAGPLERGWEAPPGAAPPKPRKQLVPQGGANGQQPTRVGARNARIRSVEDFSGPAPSEDDEELSVSVSVSTTGRRTARPRRPAAERAPRPLPEPFPASARAGAKERDDIAMPPPSEPAISPAQRAMTVEENLSGATRRRGKMVAIAGVLALVGVFSFVVAAWRLGGQPGDEGKPGVAPDLALRPSEAPPAQVPPEPVPIPQPSPPPPEPVKPTEPAQHATAQARPPAEDEDASEVKLPPKSQRAYLTISTNSPARVYIDGERVSRQAPLSRFPIKAGTRLIRLVSIATGEAQDSELRFARGQHRKLVVNFVNTPRR